MPPPADAANPVRAQWDRLSRLPGGRRLFGLVLGRLARYTGTIRPRVRELSAGHARVEMRDRPAVRNHLRSVHAVALLNLAEATSGLALNYALPADARAILTGLSIEYLKKARGTLVATTDFDPPRTNERREYDVVSVIRDADGDEVARATARWLVGPGTGEGVNG